MNRNRMTVQSSQGRLPASAPLANPYVPFQLKNPRKYEPPKALIRGTAYPDLDLPFMGMVNNMPKKASPLSNLQTLGFMVQDLALYLDTHRDDKEALEVYRSYQKIYHKGMMEYSESKPLKHGMPTQGERYRWLDDPWPWEYAANKEG